VRNYSPSSAILLAVVVLAAAGLGASDAPPSARVVIGYVYGSHAALDPALVDAARITHVNYAFADIRDGEVVEGGPFDAQNLAALTGLRKAQPQLRILVSVGGWTWSGGFSDAALSAESRARFVASAVAFVHRHDLDGFDVDWEYPGLPGNGNVHRPEDKEHFTALMRELRKALDAERPKGRPRPLLTFAAGSFADFLAHVEIKKLAKIVDYVNLMTYDFRVQGAEKVSGHHANLFPNPWDDRSASADTSVRAFREAGVPAKKLVLGVPFYGRAWAMTTAERNGLYQVGNAPQPAIDASYTRLSGELIGRNGFARMWDAEAKAPYLWNASDRIFISYEDPESLALKCEYIRTHGLAGAMFWQLGDDMTGELLRVLADGLR